ncbi:PAF acetylhydrolase family protein [Periconia macrospinosa]|uniref:1-alkyl-2-acetylglycerophosphocholine esterase n=1 Tax=Periconia macrospinosa TaxID=97972 RepID=A0A2V1E3P7_9PLEO|nr:PAF acetylhydrolase family protein [Periconia macrospinosa]
MLLTDLSRVDPFSHNGQARSVMVSSFFPVSDCYKKSLTPYMPPGTGKFTDEKFSAYGLPDQTFQNITIETCEKFRTSSRSSSEALPLVIFSGALGTSRHLYNALLQNVAANGYLVVSIDHPYDADIVEFPDGTIIHGVNISDAEVELALSTRVSDVHFVYQQLQNQKVAGKLFHGHLSRGKLPKTAMFGHSLGGATAASAMPNMSTILGAVNLDGTLFGPVLTHGLDSPLMLIGHENKTRETDPSWTELWPRLRGWKKEYEIKNTAHYSFSDLPLIASVLGIQNQLPLEVKGMIGMMEGKRAMQLTVDYVTAFLDMVLKSSSGNELGKLDKRYIEAVQVA